MAETLFGFVVSMIWLLVIGSLADQDYAGVRSRFPQRASQASGALVFIYGLGVQMPIPPF